MLRSLFHRIFRNRVLAGPFRGLNYIPSSIGSVHLAKLVGTYECELDAQIERLIARQPDVVINIGAAEGYYAVGLACRLPPARIIAFETETRGQALVQQLAERNGVASRIQINGTAAAENLIACLHDASRPCVVIDAEGAEDFLLDPSSIPALARCDVLVEVHDFVAPIGDRLWARFAATHRREEIWSHPRQASDLTGWRRLLALPPWRQRVLKAIDEGRPERMRWFWFETTSR